MKKSIFVTLLLLVASVGVTMAQEQPNTYYGGKKGDWMVGFDARSTSSPNISAGYMLSDRWMLDADVDLYLNGMIEEYSRKYTEDTSLQNYYDRDYNTQTIGVAVGVKYLLFPGERLQAYVGGKLCMETYRYYSATDYSEEVSTTDSISLTDRSDYGMSVTFGADYFITPRMAIGGRLSLGALVGLDINDSTTTSNSTDKFQQSIHATYNWTIRSNNNCILLSFYF